MTEQKLTVEDFAAIVARFTTGRRRQEMARKPWVDLDDAQRRAILDWLVDTCLVFGSERVTAYRVAATFAKGLDDETGRVREEKDERSRVRRNPRSRAPR